MALGAKTRLGPYEILGQIGAGGMGEVYRARDSRLERTVAIKILPCELSTNPTLKQRFEREAKTISNLSHPHICTLHDVGHQDGVDYLVMEYLEGQTLAERLSRGPLPIEEVLRYALQICEALDKAHRQGVIHRDLKPGNIMLTKHGVKLLDFGLAKWTSNSGPVVDAAATLQATAKESITEQGTILGTFQYMAPEQLEGKEADARTDIFAFGAVLYEMASGKKAFTGKSRASLMAAILEREPERLTQIAPLTPPPLDRVVAGCLAKDPEERWQTAHDLKLQLRGILEGGSESGVPRPVASRRKSWELIAWGLALAMTLVAATALFRSKDATSSKPRILRFKIDAPPETAIGWVALSPSGGKLAIMAVTGSKQSLYVQSLDSLEAQPLSKTEGARFPFWSPDEQNVAFFADGFLKRMNLQSGIVASLCPAPDALGGSWSKSGTILFAQNGAVPLHKVDAAGGPPIPVTTLSDTEGSRHRSPWFLPDGEHFLFWAGNDTADDSANGIYLSALNSPRPPRLLIRGTGSANYAAGHLIYFKNRQLMAARFDPNTHKLLGHPFPIADNVGWHGFFLNTGVFSAADDGSLVYQSDAVRRQGRVQLTWYANDGRSLGTVGGPGNFMTVHLSPDGRFACVEDLDPDVGSEDILIWDLDRNSSEKLTSDQGNDRHPIWSPDGQRLVFSSNRNKVFDLFIKERGSIHPEEPLLRSPEPKFARSWSTGAQHLLFDTVLPNGTADTWVLHMNETPPRSERLLWSEHTEHRARFSPNGKWIVYELNDRKTSEIFVISFPELRGKRKISAGGGRGPRWARDGTRIYYLDPEHHIREVSVEYTANGLESGAPRRLFQIRPGNLMAPFDVAPDGRILAITELSTTNTVPLTLVLNWPLEFQRR